MACRAEDQATQQWAPHPQGKEGPGLDLRLGGHKAEHAVGVPARVGCVRRRAGGAFQQAALADAQQQRRCVLPADRLAVDLEQVHPNPAGRSHFYCI